MAAQFTPPDAVKFDPAMWQAARSDSAGRMNSAWDARKKPQFQQEGMDFQQSMSDRGVSLNSDAFTRNQSNLYQNQSNQQNDAYSMNDAAAGKEVMDIENINQGRQKIANDSYFQGQDLGLRTDQFDFDKLDRNRAAGLDQSKFDYDKTDRDRVFGLDNQKFTYDMRDRDRSFGLDTQKFDYDKTDRNRAAGLDSQKFTYDMRTGDRDYTLRNDQNEFDKMDKNRGFTQDRFEFGRNNQLARGQFRETKRSNLATEANARAAINKSGGGGGGGGGLKTDQVIKKTVLQNKLARKVSQGTKVKKPSRGREILDAYGRTLGASEGQRAFKK